ncbi:MAG: NADH-quinone oxidoreductase subunit L [Zavarzinella sp.]
MISWLMANPGRLYLLATGLPLAAFVLLLIGGTFRQIFQRHVNVQWCRFLYLFLGGSQPIRSGAVLATVAIAASTLIALLSLQRYFQDTDIYSSTALVERWSEKISWVQLSKPADSPASTLELGYHIDGLTAILFAMVTLIATCVFIFSFGYMDEESKPTVDDHVAHVKRPGRFGRFYLFLSLFSFSMLHLLISSNLLQVFISWELVGVCSFFLIGFYHERASAGSAANKAFIMNRIGDAGFLVALAIIWHAFGTFDITTLSEKVTNEKLPISHEWWVVAGLGIFLGCVGKSAQFPLLTWLPDAMEGPTPVSALIHAATMVAAGVYLVARCYLLLDPDVRLVIAYTGTITLFLAACTAMVMTDIKKVLAYSTVSQLGYMMLALGVGGWVAGTFHLLTHAFFKALLFLCSGSVIHGCHHEQEMTKMGGLRIRMRITAITMLIAVLAIAGFPFLSGWYSKDAILSNALGYAQHSSHWLLAVIPMLTVGITSFYMFRMWYLTFIGTPRSEQAKHAHESPRSMTIPLIFLALFSVAVGWGWPFWDAHASYLGHLLHDHAPEQVTSLALENHWAGWIGLFMTLAGFAIATMIYAKQRMKPMQIPLVQRTFQATWYIDRLYAIIGIRALIRTSALTARFDKNESQEQSPRFRLPSVDGCFNSMANCFAAAGMQLKQLQSGAIRGYVTAMLLATVVLLLLITLWTW